MPIHMRDLVYASLLVIGGTIVKGGAYVVISRLVVGVLVGGCVCGRRRDEKAERFTADLLS